MEKHKRIMNYMGCVIWYYDGAFMVAKGDGTDDYFSSMEEAMEFIDNKHNKIKRI